MKNRYRGYQLLIVLSAIAFFVCLVLAVSNASAQTTLAPWKHVRYVDDAGKTTDKFSLDGVYLISPRMARDEDAPQLVVMCSGGKVIQQYGIVRSVLWAPVTKIDYRIADQNKIVASNVTTTRNPLLTGADKTHWTFSMFDVKSVLNRTLFAHEVTMAIRGPSTTNLNSSAGPLDPIIIMHFEIPDSLDLLATCGIKIKLKP